jgi:hypothetical protein
MERFINTLFEDRGKAQNLLKEIKNLGPEDRKFIDEKAVELEQIDNEIASDVQMNINPNLNLGLKKLQMNILTLFLMSKIQNPDCSEEIRKIIMKFNKKIATVNQILEKNLNRVGSSSNQQLLSSNQQLTSSNQQLTSSNTQLLSSNQQLLSSNQQLSSSNQQLSSSNQQLSSSNKQLSSSNQQLSSSNQQLSSSNQPSPIKSSSIQPNNSSDLIRNQQVELARLSKINSKNELINYLKEFNVNNAVNDNSSKENEPADDSLKTLLLKGIDNPKYKDAVEKLMNDEFEGKYTYANLFGLPLAVKQNYEESSQPISSQQQSVPVQKQSVPVQKQSVSNQQQPTTIQQQSVQSQPIEDMDDYVEQFIKGNNLSNKDPMNEDLLPDNIKTQFIGNPAIGNNKQVMDLVNSKPFTMALLTEIRGL